MRPKATVMTGVRHLKMSARSTCSSEGNERWFFYRRDRLPPGVVLARQPHLRVSGARLKVTVVAAGKGVGPLLAMYPYKPRI